MYEEWASFTLQLSCLGEANQSVLSKLPPDDALKVVDCVAKTVASQLGLSSSQLSQQSLQQQQQQQQSHQEGRSFLAPLCREEEIAWFMEVVCYGLSLPLTELDTVKDCVSVYCEWLSALLPEPKACVPQPIVDEPNRFGRKIVRHLFHLFVPRKGSGTAGGAGQGTVSSSTTSTGSTAASGSGSSSQETIHRQAVLCHRVLRRIQDVVQQSKIIDRETWETLLGFLLAINDALLSPPTVKEDVGDQLSERVLSVLYEVWMVACVKCFPPPSLWKTFREMAMNWRHRVGLVDQWNSVCQALTRRLVLFMYGDNFLSKSPKPAGGDKFGGIPAEMSNECIAQAWYGFLHSLGNPVDLSRPTLVSQTQAFYQYAIEAEDVVDPTHHPCLSSLPEIFSRAMKGLSGLVDIFLAHDASNEVSLRRPRCNSVLHLFGGWLFEASLVGSEYLIVEGGRNQARKVSAGKARAAAAASPKILPENSQASINNAQQQPSSASKTGLLKKVSGSSMASTATATTTELPDGLSPAKFEAGKAEAIGALCRIFCSKRTDESISPIYLARFYVALHQGLESPENQINEVITKILINSKKILLVDLDGVLTVLPSLLGALEIVLSVSALEQVARQRLVAETELRSAGISLLTSMLPFPVYFQGLPIKDIVPRKDNEASSAVITTFADLQLRLLDLWFETIQVETNAVNVQHLLGGLMFLVQEYSRRDIADSKNSTVQAGPGETVNIRIDAAHAVFVKATHLVCQRLVSSWKSDLNTSLAALELLGGLARTEVPMRSPLECKRTVRWLCDFVVTQCSRPPPAHSKDLHSSIVAAFFCCKTWILHHPYLLQDKECTSTVMEVIELGISGSKSAPKIPGDSSTVTFKEDKALSPASRRVKDAAESLQITLLEQVDQYPSKAKTLCGEPKAPPIEEIERYRYFVIDNSVILGMDEQSSSDGKSPPQPKVLVIIRSPSDKSSWTMSLRHLPRHKSGLHQAASNPGRPVPSEEACPRQLSQPSFFPDSVDSIPLCNADRSIPAVESVAGDDRSMMELDELSQIIEEQSIREAASLSRNYYQTKGGGGGYQVETECKAPVSCQEFQTSRLILAHLGFFRPSSIRENPNSPLPKIVLLNSEGDGFVKDMEALDSLSTRTVDHVYVYYVKSGQHQMMTDGEVKAVHFLEFLSSLGRPTHYNVEETTTTTGLARDVQGDPTTPAAAQFWPQTLNKALVWDDASSEMMFFVPALGPLNKLPDKEVDDGQEDPVVNKEAPHHHQHSLKRQTSTATMSDVKVLVVWLESFEDNQTFPLDQVLAGIPAAAAQGQQQQQPGSQTAGAAAADCLVIFIHELRSGLLRVHLRGRGLKSNASSPLADGMVVTRQTIGALVRQTALNISSRRRLEQENYLQSHVRRKLKIQELAKKYRCPLSTAEFYSTTM